MKKLLILMLILISSVALFALKNEYSVKLIPYSLQIMTNSEEPDYKVISDYGFGTEACYRKGLRKGLFAEGGFSCISYNLPDERENLISLMLFAGLGYSFQLSQFLGLSIHKNVGADTRFFKSVTENITFTTGFDFSFLCAENTKITLGSDAAFCFTKESDIYYASYRIIPMLGLSICF